MKKLLIVVVVCLLPSLSFAFDNAYEDFRMECNKIKIDEIFPEGVPNGAPDTIEGVCNEIVEKARMNQVTPNMSGKEFKARAKCGAAVGVVVDARIIHWPVTKFFTAPLLRAAVRTCHKACADFTNNYCPNAAGACDAEDIEKLWKSISRKCDGGNR